MAARNGTPFIYMGGHYLLLSSCGFLSRPNCAARVFAGGIPQVPRGVRDIASTVRSVNQWRPSPQRRRLSDPLRPPQMTEALHGKPEASRYSGYRTCSLPVLSGTFRTAPAHGEYYTPRPERERLRYQFLLPIQCSMCSTAIQRSLRFRAPPPAHGIRPSRLYTISETARLSPDATRRSTRTTLSPRNCRYRI